MSTDPQPTPESRRLFPSWWDAALALVAVAMALYHLINVYFSVVGTIEHRMIHLVFALVLIFLGAAKAGKGRWFWWLMIAASLSVVAYLWINLESLLFNVGFPTILDVVVGFLVLFIVFAACWQSFGWILPSMACLLLAYGFFGHLLGGPELSVGELITTVDLTFGSYDLWGTILIISANVIFLFIFFGGMLGALGANDFFLELGKVVGRYSRSGPAMTAVISSALMGTTTGQATPNIAVTGAFTIPLMKRVGYKPEVAASVEAAASGGAQIMPPIMGAGAFVMADLLGVPYADIISAAAIPAALYFVSVAFFVHFSALKLKVAPLTEKPDRGVLLATAPLFMVPVAAILVLFFLGFPAMFAAFWGIVSLLALSLLRRRTRPPLKRVLAGCVKGAVTGAKVAVACATLGPIIALVTKTGLGMLVGYSVETWAGGSLFVALVMAMGCVIILGLEVPTVAAYLVGAMVAIPALIRLGLEPIQAHMFAFYFGAFSGLTPPVGMAAIVASRIAEARYIKTALLSIGAAVAGFLVPYVFAYNGSLLLTPGTQAGPLMATVTLVVLGLGALQMSFVGYLAHRLNLLERGLSLAAGLGLLVAAALGLAWLLVPAGGLLAGLVINNLRKRRGRAAGPDEAAAPSPAGAAASRRA
ncbi:MAG: TRAP transporter fused permease subunit [Desulfarculaceae bacterium]|nr:TRAP transporter fused permease subunit [Desulfarculaceae bacterium]MCF8072694.1 TRAP transporter fused permease subunit [Desulfarculaceae bacterium]MCF8102573.1 TRAP transporter fused permease subunit [Desulfarculaceae bacterium]MCF8116482.1 TRAP transporter fused permease subunit [Desulfarculaceae bacterium]